MFNAIHARSTFCTLALLLLFCSSAEALPKGSTPRLNLITPRGIQRGHQHVLRFNGSRLNETLEVFVYDTGIEVKQISQVDANNVDVTIEVAGDCRLGEHIAQIRTSRGISDFRSFYVGNMLETQEAEPNNSKDQSQKVDLDRTINGVITPEDIDVFQLQCKQGQRLSVEIEAIRLGFMFDAFVAVVDERNFELAVSDDSELGRQDGVISLEIPADGMYYVVVRESSYGGNGNCRYRLHIGQFPRPTVAFPAGGPKGTHKIQFLSQSGNHLEKEIDVNFDDVFRSGIYVQDDFGISPSPVAFRQSELPNHLEVEPNEDRKETVPSAVAPCAFNGIIQVPGDVDYFKFSAQKGEVFDVDVYARRIRSGLDSVINIFDSKGKHIVGDDDARRPDSYLRFNTPETGEYFLRVRDHLNRGRSDFVYRVEIKRLVPNLLISIPRVDRYSQLRQKICVPRGNRFATLISADRKNFGGPIELVESDWPDGITVDFKPMVANLNLMPVVFTASESAELSGKLVDVKARHTDPKQNIEGHFNLSADFALGQPNNASYFKSEVDRLACAVTEKIPFKIEIIQPNVPLVRNGSMNLKIVVDRDEGFDEPINLQFPFRPPGLGTKPQVQIKKGESEAYYPLNANSKAQLGKWPVYAIGQANVDGPVWASSQLAELEITEPYVTVEMNRTSLEQGQTAAIFCKLNHVKSFEGEATAELLGIPPHIDIPKLSFTKDTKELNFSVATSEKSRIGKHKGLFCRITIIQNNEPIVSTAARSELQINKPQPKAQKTDVANAEKQPNPKTKKVEKPKPKSRLQQLREAARAKSGR